MKARWSIIILCLIGFLLFVLATFPQTPDPALADTLGLPAQQVGGCTTYTKSGSIAIPDDDETGITSTLTLPPVSGKVTYVQLSMGLYHSYPGDLGAFLTTPNVCESEIFDGDMGSEDIDGSLYFANDGNMYLYDDSPPYVNLYKPNVAFPTNFRAGGRWTLHVVDHAGWDIGDLTGWSVTLCTGSARPADGPATYTPEPTYTPPPTYTPAPTYTPVPANEVRLCGGFPRTIFSAPASQCPQTAATPGCVSNFSPYGEVAETSSTYEVTCNEDWICDDFATLYVCNYGLSSLTASGNLYGSAHGGNDLVLQNQIADANPESYNNYAPGTVVGRCTNDLYDIYEGSFDDAFSVTIPGSESCGYTGSAGRRVGQFSTVSGFSAVCNGPNFATNGWNVTTTIGDPVVCPTYVPPTPHFHTPVPTYTPRPPICGTPRPGGGWGIF